ETGGDNDVIGAARTTANPQDIASDALLAKLVWDIDAANTLRLTYDRYESEVAADVLSGRSASVLELLAQDDTARERIGLDWRFDDILGFDGQIAVYQQ